VYKHSIAVEEKYCTRVTAWKVGRNL